ncbi:MAG TPA: membrane protein insertase YidC [Planctomycetota bacterium]|nr:membrane protein insertase YidC [Planctomycetota bacterium]
MSLGKRFDTVTIVGLVVAVALLIGGQMWVSSRQEHYAKIAKQQRDEAEAKAKAEQEKRDAERKAAAEKGEKPADTKIEAAHGDPAPKDPKDPKPADPKPESAAVTDDAEKTPDIVVAGDFLELTFSAKGASLSKAVLAGVPVNPAEPKSKIGLELLGEIEAGKRNLGIPYFEIGPPAAEQDADRIKFDQASGALRSLDERIWKLEENSKGFDGSGSWKIVYSTKLNQKYLVTKTIIIEKAKRYIHVDVGVRNESDAPVTVNYILNGPAGILLDGPPEDPKRGAFVYAMSEIAGRDPAQGKEPTVKQHYPGSDEAAVTYPENLWGALKNRFYTAMLISLEPASISKIKTLALKTDPTHADKRLAEPNEGIQAVRKRSESLEAQKGTRIDRYAMYMGPANEAQLMTAEQELKLDSYFLSHAIHYCDIFYWQWPRVDWLARKMMVMFTWLYSLFGNYGLSVILLTLIIKLALHPLQRKGTISMSKMQKLQPEIKKIQDKYKDQKSTEARQRMMQETQDLYSRAGISPLSGCLPMFLQIPIFSALYGVFNRAWEIRGAEFLWIKDLSQQDMFAHIPFWPHEINLLPIIYVVMTIIQQFYITPPPKTDDPSQEQMRKMMMFMPLMFSIMFYRMPSGLILYFAAQAIFGMLESWYIKKYLIKDDPFTPVSGAPATGKPPPAVVPAK